VTAFAPLAEASLYRRGVGRQLAAGNTFGKIGARWMVSASRIQARNGAFDTAVSFQAGNAHLKPLRSTVPAVTAEDHDRTSSASALRQYSSTRPAPARSGSRPTCGSARN
jgi:hypothetical protein